MKEQMKRPEYGPIAKVCLREYGEPSPLTREVAFPATEGHKHPYFTFSGGWAKIPNIDVSLIEHINPISWDNVILYGEYVVDRDLIKL